MMELCGADCCEKCPLYNNECAGCAETDGHPCEGNCVAAECVKKGGILCMNEEKDKLIKEINALGIPGLSVNELYQLNGSFVNLCYPVSDGQTVKFLNDKNVYWGNQTEIKDTDRCYGVVADTGMIIVSTYGQNGTEPELILYKKR